MTTQLESVIADNLARVEERIQAACDAVGRAREEVTLVAVSKTRTMDEIVAAIASGASHLGENRVEELETKAPALVEQLGGLPTPTWHMIGHIQSRKAARAAAVSDLVHSVDSLRLARRLDRAAGELDKRLPALIEVNVSGEEAKYGFDAKDDAGIASLIIACETLNKCGNLDVRGLMTMAPFHDDPEQTRPVFRRMVALRERLRTAVPDLCWDELSMGMTNDYVVAIEEGATMVRIGRAIFGERIYTESDLK